MSYPAQSNHDPPPPPYGTDFAYRPPVQQTIVYQTIGDCPQCRQGYLQSDITCLGICCAICLFPLGLICLFLLQEQRCSHCGYCTS